MPIAKSLSEEIIELWKNEFSAVEREFNGQSCFQIGALFIRLDTYPAIDEGKIYCIEAANEHEAANDIFEDAWKYWDGDGADTILQKMRDDLRAELDE